MKRILVPMDFSEYAENALKAAAIFAKKNNAEIFLLHLLELPGQMNDAMTTGSSVPEVMLFINKANDLLQKTTEQPYLEGITVSTSVQFEKAFNGIMSFTKSNKIDLIVMGSRIKSKCCGEILNFDICVFKIRHKCKILLLSFSSYYYRKL